MKTKIVKQRTYCSLLTDLKENGFACQQSSFQDKLLAKYRNHPRMTYSASYGDDVCILKVAYLKNWIADQQNMLGLRQQWTNETNTVPKGSFWVEFSFNYCDYSVRVNITLNSRILNRTCRGKKVTDLFSINRVQKETQ